jgi:hypothetical protein
MAYNNKTTKLKNTIKSRRKEWNDWGPPEYIC